jgi:cytidylate kinase
MNRLTQEEERVKADILQRDQRDGETAHRVKAAFAIAGLAPVDAGISYVLNTNDSPGPEHNALVLREYIVSTMPEAKVITVEGASGSGKSDTARHLARILPGCMVSFGELFRYMVWCSISNNEAGPLQTLSQIHFEVNEAKVDIWKEKVNISQTLAVALRAPELEAIIPEMSEVIQVPVIRFMLAQLTHLRHTSRRPLILEGRGYHLHYLPADLRIRLEVDVDIRAQRRASQRKVTAS